MINSSHQNSGCGSAMNTVSTLPSRHDQTDHSSLTSEQVQKEESTVSDRKQKYVWEYWERAKVRRILLNLVGRRLRGCNKFRITVTESALEMRSITLRVLRTAVLRDWRIN